MKVKARTQEYLIKEIDHLQRKLVLPEVIANLENDFYVALLVGLTKN